MGFLGGRWGEWSRIAPRGGRQLALGYRIDEVPVPVPPNPQPGDRVFGRDYTRPRTVNYEGVFPVPPFGPISVDRNDPPTIRRGMLHRLARQMPEADRRRLRMLAGFVDEYCRDNLNPVLAPPDFDEWLAHSSYNEERKQQLREANLQNHGSHPPLRVAQRVSSHAKAESYVEYKNLRWINSRHDRFKAWCGPFFHAIEQCVFSHNLPSQPDAVPSDGAMSPHHNADEGLAQSKGCFDELVCVDHAGRRTHSPAVEHRRVIPPFGPRDVRFIKYIPVAQRVEAINMLERPGWYYYQTDFTSFEAAFKRPVMRALELRLYRYMLPWMTQQDFAYLDKVLTGVNRLSTRTGQRAKIHGRRMSGEMCTSLGNGFSNAMLFLFFAKWHGVNLNAWVEGDDGLFAVDRKFDPAYISQWYAKLGFLIKVDELEKPSLGHFCGLTFGSDGQIVRDPAKFLSKFGWIQRPIGARRSLLLGRMRAKAMSTLCETPDCPIVGEFAFYVFRQTHHERAIFEVDAYHKVSIPKFVRPPAPTHGTRQLFFQRYGVTPQSQLACEAAIRAGRLEDVCKFVLPHRDMVHYDTCYVLR